MHHDDHLPPAGSHIQMMGGSINNLACSGLCSGLRTLW